MSRVDTVRVLIDELRQNNGLIDALQRDPALPEHLLRMIMKHRGQLSADPGSEPGDLGFSLTGK